MNKPKKKWLSLLLTLAIGFSMILGSSGVAQAASFDKTKSAFEKCGNYL